MCIVIGVINLFSKDPAKKKSGTIALLIGLGIFGIEIIIGLPIYMLYSVCSSHH